MAERVIPMRVIAAVVAFVAGEKLNVARVCRDAEVSRKTFYKYVERVRAEGPAAGFEPRSRRPHSCPHAVRFDVEEAVVEFRKQLDDAGVDHGATTIQWHLGRDPRFKRVVPSVATVHRILWRRGFVLPQPEKRPKSSWRRFEAPVPNEWWQIDATEWVVATGLVKIFNIVDDHSRVVCRSRAVLEATSEQAWTTFCQAAERWGLPAGVLSDNGLCFSGKLRGLEVLFEARLRDAGIRPITGRPYHPQTTGKVERFQQTLKKWLRRQDRRRGLARDLDELQGRLDEFCVYYNEQRPHQGIGRVTPLSRWQAGTAATPAAEPLPHPRPRHEPLERIVTKQGVVKVDDIKIGVGVRWAGCTVTVIIDERHATIFSDGELIRHLTLDRSRTYQPTGARRGGPRQARHLPS
jgi:transposase InsO family protein